MTSSPEVGPKSEPPLRLRSRRRKGIALCGVIAAVVVVIVSSLTFVAPWAPLAHFSCQRGSQASTTTAWVPLSLLNTPYGGRAFVNATLPQGMFGGSANSNSNPPNLVGGHESNGTVWGSFWKMSLAIYTAVNTTLWGPGSTSRCTQQFELGAVSVAPAQGFLGALFLWPGAPLFGPNSSSNINEPEMVNFSAAYGDSSTIFWNGFHSANSQNVSTCGRGAQTASGRSNFLTTGVPFRLNGRPFTFSITLPITQNFSYWFPPNFGTWQVDNLSAPGGPGGGWAFSYSPCP